MQLALLVIALSLQRLLLTLLKIAGLPLLLLQLPLLVDLLTLTFRGQAAHLLGPMAARRGRLAHAHIGLPWRRLR